MSCAVGFSNAVEQRVPVDLAIRGTIPPWLSGVLYRTGPGVFDVLASNDPSKVVSIQHWFDGLGMNHRFEIHPGGTRVSYRSRKSTEDLEQRMADAGKVPGVTFGQRRDPCESLFHKFFTTFKRMVLADGLETSHKSPSGGNVQVTLTPDMPGWEVPSTLPAPASGPRYLVAKTDASPLQMLDPTTLDPLDLSSYKELDARLDGQLSAAHSCRDRETGDFFNFSCKIGGPFPTYKVFRISREGKVDILAEINDAPLSYIHSFAMTQKYVVLCVWQAYITFSGLSILYNENIAQSIDQKSDPKSDALFYVIDRQKGGVVSKYKTPPFFCFHHLNAYDDPTKDEVVIDVTIYPDASVINLLYLDKLRNLASSKDMRVGRARRFRLQDVTSATLAKPRDALVEFTLSAQHSIELPSIKPELFHKPYRYAYGINKADPLAYNVFADRVIKVDMANPDKEHKSWGASGYTPGEPIFVSRPGAVEEDDGVLLSVVLDGEAGRSMLVVLDAREMKEVARAEMQTHFPIGFHGVWTGD